MKVVFISFYVGDKSTEDAYGSMADEFLHKLFKPDFLAKTVRCVLDSKPRPS